MTDYFWGRVLYNAEEYMMGYWPLQTSNGVGRIMVELANPGDCVCIETGQEVLSVERLEGKRATDVRECLK